MLKVSKDVWRVPPHHPHSLKLKMTDDAIEICTLVVLMDHLVSTLSLVAQAELQSPRKRCKFCLLICCMHKDDVKLPSCSQCLACDACPPKIFLSCWICVLSGCVSSVWIPDLGALSLLCLSSLLKEHTTARDHCCFNLMRNNFCLKDAI